MNRWHPWGSDIEEPILTHEDRDLWSYWSRVWLTHAKTLRHCRMVDNARACLAECLSRAPEASIAFSCGKDSTALMLLAGTIGVKRAHIICSDVNMHLRWREYCRSVETATGIQIEEWWPQNFSAREYVSTGSVGAIDSICSDSDPLARKGFFDVARMTAIERGKPGLIMGLRAEESKGRRVNRKFRGLIYQHSDYGLVANPLSDWTWLDVYAYILSSGIEPFHAYYCLRVKNDPKMRRLDGWMPGSWAADGAGVELRVFYPSLFEQWQHLFGRHVEIHT